VIDQVLVLSGSAPKVYFALLHKGPMEISGVVSACAIKTPTAYAALASLEAIGAITRTSRVTDFGVPMPSIFTATYPLDNENAQVRDPIEYERVGVDMGEMSDLDSLEYERVNGRYVVSSKSVSLGIGVLRTPHPSGAERLEGDVGYEFFDQASDTPAPRRRKPGPSPAQERMAEKSATRRQGRAMRPETDWTSMDVAQFWRDEAMRAYPMKAGTVGSTKTMSQIFAKRSYELHEAPEVQAEMVRRFLSDPRLAAKANKRLTMLALLLSFCNRNADDVRKYLAGAEDRAKVEEIMQSDESIKAYYDEALAKMDAELGLI
jgi:hypothetical protein